MDNLNNIQGLLAGLQQQISSISSLASAQAGVPTYPMPGTHNGPNPSMQGSQDIQAIVRATLAEEIAKLVPQSHQPPQLEAPAVPVLPAPPQPQVASVDLKPAAEKVDQTKPQERAVTTPPKDSMQEAMLKDFLNRLRISIGAGLTLDQQEWLSANLFELPGFFKSEAGKASLSRTLADYKAYLG